LNPRALGMALAGGGVLVLSPDTILIRLLDTDVATTLFWRGVAMAAGLGVFLLIRERGRPGPIMAQLRSPLGLALGVLFALSNLLFVTTVHNTSIADTLACLATASIFAAVFSAVFLRERAPLRTWITAGAIAAALLLIALGGAGSLFGRLTGISAAMSLGATFVVMRATGHGDTLPGLALGGALIALVSAYPAAPLALSTEGFAALAGLILILPLAFALIGQGPRYLPAPEVSLLMLLETVFGTLWAWLWLDEIPRGTTLLAVAIILSSLALFYWRQAVATRGLQQATT
jgi:drug/metabolite transporter (DMT)-like permease